MDEKKVRELFEEALNTCETSSGKLFFDTLMDFEFQYNEEKERVIIQVPVTKMMYNPIGVLHGGIIMYIADTAMGHLCAVFGKPSVSLELSTQFYKATKDGTIKAEAYFLRKGKNIQFAECVLHNEDGEMIAKVSGTYYAVK